MCSHPLSIYEVEGAPPVFAVLALVRLSTNGVETYLSVSRKKDPLAKGLPGGKIDPEETFREALVRELLEETGLLAKELHPVFDAVDTSGKRCLTYEVTSYTGALSTQESGVVEWISQEALTAPGPFESYNRALFQHIDPYSRYLDR
jgi:8-oxo-dGTP pyrophosphatase MutT (NUDIX family)